MAEPENDLPVDSGAGAAPETSAVDAKLTEIWDRSQAERELPAGDVAAAEPETAEQKEARARDEQGRFVAKEDTAQGAKPAEEAAAPAQEATEQTQAVQAPQHWPDDRKATFSKLPADAQASMLGLAKDLEGGYTRAMQQISNERRKYEAINPVLAPIEEEARRYGVPVQNALQGLWTVHTRLLDPASRMQALRKIADDYAIDLNEVAQLEPSPPQFQLPPEVDQRIRSVEEFAKSAHQQAFEEKVRGDAGQIAAWMDEADQSGGKLRPHVEDVKDHMALLMPALLEQFPNDTVVQRTQRAYEAACAANPTIRQKIIEAEVAKRLAPVHEQERQRGAKAAVVSSTASLSRRGGGGAAAPAKAEDPDKILDSIWSKHQGTA